MKFCKSCFFANSLIMTLLLTGHAYAEEYRGTLLWSKRMSVSTPVSGVIEQVYVNVGDKVPANGKLLQLDDVVLQANLVSSRTASINRTEEYKEAKRELERMQELYNRTMLSEHELQVAKNNLVKARAIKEKAKANFTKAQNDLKFSTVRAPFDALILERMVQPGVVISAQLQPETLFIIADARHMLARILVSEKQLERVKQGKEAFVFVADTRYQGKVVAIGLEPAPASSGNTGYPVDVELTVQDKLLRSGQQAKVVIE